MIFKSRKVCPPGYTRRKGYTRKNTGTRVKGVCVRSTSPHNYKPENRGKTMKRRIGALLGTRKRCGPGKIPRSAYVRRISSNVARKGFDKRTRSGKVIHIFPKVRSVFVPSTCITDLGKKGKLPEGAEKIGPLRKGELQKYGYSYKLPETQRREALRKAVGAFGPLSTYRKLDAVAKLSERTNPKAAQVFSADRNWIQQTYSDKGVLRAF